MSTQVSSSQIARTIGCGRLACVVTNPQLGRAAKPSETKTNIKEERGEGNEPDGPDRDTTTG
jgi:hypothetical protein